MCLWGQILVLEQDVCGCIAPPASCFETRIGPLQAHLDHFLDVENQSIFALYILERIGWLIFLLYFFKCLVGCNDQSTSR